MGIPSRGAPSGRRRAPHARGRAGGALASLGVALGALHACTLTSDDFEPALRQRAPLEPAAQEPAARPDPAPGAGLEGAQPSEAASASLELCAEGLACPDGYACAADRCVPSQCAASEDLPSCVGTWCPDGSCAAAQCSDGRLGPGEVDVDCGGPCVRCALGAVCVVDADCAQGGCVGGLCSKPSCADETQNGDETGTDCGGSCSPCGDGGGCRGGSDCRSGVCGACADAGTCCAPASCSDGITNGDELATDCGGACGPCPLGAACTAPSSCASNVCLEGSCAALCANGRRDGDESEVDCGGSELGCPRCDDGRACVLDGDCSSGRCDGVCISCTDGIANGDELGLDCGSSEAGCPACPRCDAESSVPLGPLGSATPLDASDCAMLARFASYPPTLLESFDDGPYPVPFTWRQECTGAAGGASSSASTSRCACRASGSTALSSSTWRASPSHLHCAGTEPAARGVQRSGGRGLYAGDERRARTTGSLRGVGSHRAAERGFSRGAGLGATPAGQPPLDVLDGQIEHRHHHQG